MEVSQIGLLFLTLSGGILGVVLGVVYDVFRLIRTAVSTVGNGEVPQYARTWKLPFLADPNDRKRRNPIGHGVTVFVTVLCDTVFGLIAGIAIFLLLYAQNDGVFRLSAPIWTAVGFFLYRFTLGRLTAACEDAILFFIGIVFRYVCLVFSLPFCRIARIFVRLWRITLSPVFEKLREDRANRASERNISALLRGADAAYFGDRLARPYQTDSCDHDTESDESDEKEGK